MRRERIVFENIYRKMERELQDKKQQMAEIIELSNKSYEQRDTYQMEVAAIEQANRKEQVMKPSVEVSVFNIHHVFVNRRILKNK